MPDDPSKQVEIEVALRDTASGVLKDIAKNIDDISRKLVETGRAGTSAFDKIKRGAEETGVGSKGAAGHISSLNKGMGDLAKTVGGPLGLAAGFVMVARGLDSILTKFAAHRVQLQLMTTDIGFSTEAIDQLRQALARKGVIDKGEQKQIITGIGGQMMELKMMREYSDLWLKLGKLDDPKFADGFRNNVYAGRFDEAIKMAGSKVDWLVAHGREADARFLAKQLDIPFSVLLGLNKAMENTVKVFHSSEEEARKALEKREELATKAENLSQKAMEKTITGLVNLEGAYGDLEKRIDSLIKMVQRAQGAVGGTPGGIPKTDRAPLSPKGGAPRPGTFERFPTSQEQFKPYVPGKQSSLEDGDTTLPAGATPVQFTRESVTMRETINADKESIKTLQEIRDLLQGDIDADIGGAAPGLQFRRGIRTGQRGPGGPGGGGPQVSGGAIGALGGTVHGHKVDPYGGLSGSELVEPVTATSLGGGVGGFSAAFGSGQHMGIDLMAKPNSPVVAPRGGKIVWVGSDGKYGNQSVIIDHGDGTYTRMLHINGVPKDGTVVSAGQQVGRVGFANAWHVHMEMWKGEYRGRGQLTGSLMNPRALMGWNAKNLPQQGRKIRGVTPSGPIPAPPAVPPAVEKSLNKDWKTTRASTFDDRVTASGMPASTPGIALPTRATLRQWFWVRDENTGREILTQQTDVGPARWTKRGIDINAPLARKFGYTPGRRGGNFPTDTNFSYRPAVDGALSKSGAGGRASRSGNIKAAVDFRGMRRTREAGEVFKTLKVAGIRQNETIVGSVLLPGDSDFSRWTG